MAAFSPNVNLEPEGLEWVLGMDWGAMGQSQETGQSPTEFQSASSTLFPGVSKYAHALHEQSLNLLEPPVGPTGFQTS